MSHTEATTTEPTAPPEPIDPRKAFAFAYVSRSFRLIEACSDVAIEPAAALELLKDPETTAHVNRLVATGEYAGEVLDAREMMEITSSIARTTVAEFIAQVKEAGSTESGGSALGAQSIPAFMTARLRAVALLSQMKYGKAGNLKNLLKALSKNRKRTGLDRSEIHRQVTALLATSIGKADGR